MNFSVIDCNSQPGLAGVSEKEMKMKIALY